MRTPSRFLLSLALILAVAPASPAASARRVVVLSLDAGGEQTIEQMLALGQMPNLARIRDEGVAADYARTNFTSKTAAGHASLWTGTWGVRSARG